VTCPADEAGFTFGTPVIRASGAGGGFNYRGKAYHVLICPYTGSGTEGTDFGINNDKVMTVTGLINPAPRSERVSGEADFEPWIIQELDASERVIASKIVYPSFVEATRIRANVLPYFTFTVEGVAAKTAACGQTMSATSTATLVDFGEINPTSFKDMAQKLVIATNYPTGYVVTVQSSDQMGKVGGSGEVAVCSGAGLFDYCLPSSEVAGMTVTTARPWTNVAQGGGLGYTLQNITGSDNVFDYTAGYRRLPDAEAGDGPTTIMQVNETKSASDFVCYRLRAIKRSIPGDYRNEVVYTATASF
jgi:hypothetical protein